MLNDANTNFYVIYMLYITFRLKLLVILCGKKKGREWRSYLTIV